jgi:hypothetical protein
MKVKVLRLFVVPLLLLLAPAVAQASVSLLIGEAVGGAGEFTGSGHAAVYFSAICAETPTQLRHCKPGEEGVVITSYPGLVAQTQYKWMAIPLTAFLYAVDSEDNKVLYGNGKIRKYLRNEYRLKHLSDLIPSLPNGALPTGRWSEMLGGVLNRDIYALTVTTTPQQDAKSLAYLQNLPNAANFSTAYNNCADFARDAINTIFPGATHRDVLNDFTITTPKAIASSFTRYATARPELNFHIVKYSQADGAISRSLSNRNFTEKAVVSKKYILTMAFTMPELIPIMGVTYLTTGWYNVDPQYKKYAGKEIAAINLLARRQTLITNFGGASRTGFTRKELETQRAAQREEMFGTDELWSDYRKQFAPMLSKAVERRFFLDAKEVQTFFKDLELQSEPQLDRDGRLVLNVMDRGTHETLGLTRENLLSPDNSRRLAYKLMLAKVNAVLSAPSRNRPLRREFEQDWQLLQSLAANVVAYEFPDEDRKALPRFRQVREVVSVGKRGQQLLVTITH